ncbi:hypothetical protein ACGFNU_46325 [Spirillospora sp. NPDC048911]|uniref:hypothetical protein n=1 Tax=Spirillospora sp. NPDC048911 TaxID=3364527 RepID=UPI00371A6B86
MKKLLVMPAAVLALGLSVSACGSDDKDSAGKASSSPSGAAGSTAPSAPATIDPGNTAPGSGAGNGTGGGAGNGSGGGTGKLTPAQQKMHATLVKVAKCMRTRGYTVDDPKPGDVGVTPKNVKDANQANKDSADCVKQANGG